MASIVNGNQSTGQVAMASYLVLEQNIYLKVDFDSPFLEAMSQRAYV